MASTSNSTASHQHAAFHGHHRSPRNSAESDDSLRSRTTAPTSISTSPRPSLKNAYSSERKIPITPYSKTHRAVVLRQQESPSFAEVSYERPSERGRHSIARNSEDRYATSKTPDYYDEPDEYDDDDDFVYELPDDLEQYATRSSEVELECRATTPQDFADYFPSQRRLFIHHDESTHDGNMNLKVDTEEVDGDIKTRVQLFHLRMKDLESREFSLRRYCRDSGREVCHSIRRYQLPASERPGIQRSVSNALASLRPDFKRSHSKDSSKSAPIRADSGYGSDDDGDDYDPQDVHSFMSGDSKISHASNETPTRSIKLEFSNYAQVNVKRNGNKKSKHYDFEYWGNAYSWKRVIDKIDGLKSVKYHLVRHGSSKPIAHIIPVFQTPGQARDEHAQGGWVPPCNLWISDPSVLTAYTDVAE